MLSFTLVQMTSDPEQLLLDSISIKEPLLDPTKEHSLDLRGVKVDVVDNVSLYITLHTVIY